MICIISSAKTFSEYTQLSGIAPTVPFSLDKTKKLVHLMEKFSAQNIAQLMHISARLAHGNAARYKEWETAKSVLALDGYDGDVFKAFKKEELTPKNWKNANHHLAIFSGLYGILRPTDEIKPYRLEMAINLKEILGESLHDFWSEDVTKQLNVMVREAGAKYILNVASKEYSSVLNVGNLAVPLINVDFKSQGPKGLRTVAIHAKRARGRMARFVLDNQIKSPEEIKKFDDGYFFRPELSTEGNFVFVGV